MSRPKHSKSKKRSSRDSKDTTRLREATEIETAADIVERLVDEALPEGASFEDYEKEVLEITNEIARRRIERKLQNIADGHPAALQIEHNERLARNWVWRNVGATLVRVVAGVEEHVG